MSKPKVTDVEAIIAWLQTPKEERSSLPAAQLEQFRRWNMADDLMREHLSARKVIPMLIEKYGYSKRSAERDIAHSMKVWAYRAKTDKQYMAEILADYLMETMVRAGKDRKFGDVARLAREVRETIGLHRKDDTGANDTATTIIIQAVHTPELLGVTPMPQKSLEELTRQMIKEKVEKGYIEHSTIAEIADADE